MPIYEFQCSECRNEYEELCPMGTESIKCPFCSSINTRRKVSVFSARSTGNEGTKTIGSGHSCGSCHSKNCGTCH